jgi:hypothetical protein
MITIEEYWCGHDKKYAAQLTDDLCANAVETVCCANLLIARFEQTTGKTCNGVTSGWRPAVVNEAVGGAKKSNHMIGKAVDIADPGNALDDWIMGNTEALASAGLWMEHPDATPGWCHVQTVPPRSGNRVFKP